MDWATYDAKPPVRSAPAAPQRLEIAWRAIGPSNRPITCGLYKHLRGVEVRCGYSEDDLLRSTLAGDVDEARAIAAEWKAVVIAKGLTELDAAAH